MKEMNKSAFADWKCGTSTAMFRSFDGEIASEIAAAGISCIELSFGYKDYFETLNFAGKPEHFCDLAKAHGLTLWSIHLPFSGSYDISMFDDEKRNFTMNGNLALMEAAAKASISVVVVHPSSEPIADTDRKKRLEYSKANLKILADKAASLGMRLAVEDLPRTCLCNHSDDVLYLLDGNPNLYVCFDTNHLLIQDNASFIRAVGGRIITLHVSDYDFIDERHLLPLQGKNDWAAIIKELEKAGYSGPWMYEVGGKAGAAAKDLADNKKALENLL